MYTTAQLLKKTQTPKNFGYTGSVTLPRTIMTSQLVHLFPDHLLTLSSLKVHLDCVDGKHLQAKHVRAWEAAAGDVEYRKAYIYNIQDVKRNNQ